LLLHEVRTIAFCAAYRPFAAVMDASKVHLLDVLPLFRGTRLDLQGLACLSTCSKQLKRICLAVMRSEAGRLITDALEAAAALTDQGDVLLALARDYPAMQQHIISRRGWQRQECTVWRLLRVTPTSMTAAAAASLGQRLFSIPEVPLDKAKQLVAAGVRITYAQLLAAVDSAVAGLEVWVLAQQELGIETDIPAAAATICTSMVRAWSP
jgi:hypothetical protein